MLTTESIAQIAQAHGVLSSQKSRGESVAMMILHLGEVGAGAAAMGYINGRFASEGEDHLRAFGIPVDAALGGALVIGGLVGAFGAADVHVAAIGAGCVGTFLYRTMFAKGSVGRIEQEEGRKILASGAVARGALGSETAANVVSIASAKEAAR